MALFFYWFCCADIWDDYNIERRRSTNLKVYSRPLEDHNSTALNGYFPCGLLFFYDLVSTKQQQLSACRWFLKHFIRTHLEDTEHRSQSPAFESSQCAHRDAHGSLKSQTKTGSPRGFDYKCRKLFAITNKQPSLQRQVLFKVQQDTCFIFCILHQRLMGKKVNALVLRALMPWVFCVPKSFCSCFPFLLQHNRWIVLIADAEMCLKMTWL